MQSTNGPGGPGNRRVALREHFTRYADGYVKLLVVVVLAWLLGGFGQDWEDLDTDLIQISVSKRRYQEYNPDSESGQFFYVDRQPLFKEKSPYQDIQVYKSHFFGNILLIDDAVMITERDEFHYHEMVAHVPLNYVPHAKRVLIFGGGDGGTLTQVLAHPNVNEAVIVELDKIVVKAAQLHFPKIGAAFRAPRATVVHENGATWVENRVKAKQDLGSYDVVIIDSTDFGDSAEPLFTDQFYRRLKQLVSPDGILVFNLDSPSWHPHVIGVAARQMEVLFEHVYVFQCYQPTYLSGHYAFMFASNGVNPMKQNVDWAAWRGKGIKTRYYTPQVHKAAFALPEFMLENIPKQRVEE